MGRILLYVRCTFVVGSLLLRYSFASTPLKCLYGMGGKWDLQGSYLGGRREVECCNQAKMNRMEISFFMDQILSFMLVRKGTN